MSAHENQEFGQLIAAHANRELGADAEGRLRALARDDRGRTAEVDGVDEVHGLFDAERRLYREAVAPFELQEEADPVVGRLQRRAARAEQGLRAMAVHSMGVQSMGVQSMGVQSMGGLSMAAPPGSLVPGRGRLLRFPVSVVAVAAAVMVAALLYTMWPKTPVGGTPDDHTLGAGGPGVRAPSLNILLTQHVSVQSRDISWHAVPGARSYDVVITDEANRTVFARPDDLARSTTWELTLAEIEQLQQQPGQLYLRISALDGGGFDAGSTGDRVLHVK